MDIKRWTKNASHISLFQFRCSMDGGRKSMDVGRKTVIENRWTKS
ncbi:hypothetical protein [Flavobacterium sp. DSR3-2]